MAKAIKLIRQLKGQMAFVNGGVWASSKIFTASRICPRKPWICSASKDLENESETDQRSKEVLEILRMDLPRQYDAINKMDFSIFSDDVRFDDPWTKINGKLNYRGMLYTIFAIGKVGVGSFRNEGEKDWLQIGSTSTRVEYHQTHASSFIRTDFLLQNCLSPARQRAGRQRLQNTNRVRSSLNVSQFTSTFQVHSKGFSPSFSVLKNLRTLFAYASTFRALLSNE